MRYEKDLYDDNDMNRLEDKIQILRKSLTELVNKRIECNHTIRSTDGRYHRAVDALVQTADCPEDVDIGLTHK